MLEFFKKESKKYVHLTHEEWGALSGMLMGFGLGVFIAVENRSTIINWPFIWALNLDSPAFYFVMKATIVPLSSGIFAALFSKMGHGIDVITNKETLLSYIYSKCVPPEPEQQPLIEPIDSGSSNSSLYSGAKPLTITRVHKTH